MINELMRRRAMLMARKETNPNLLSGVINNGSGGDYKIATLNVKAASSIIVGETMTLQIQLTEPLTSTRSEVRIMVNNGWIYQNKTTPGQELISFSFVPRATFTTLLCFGLPHPSVPIVIEWAKLEYGDKPTPFDGYAE